MKENSHLKCQLSPQYLSPLNSSTSTPTSIKSNYLSPTLKSYKLKLIENDSNIINNGNENNNP